MEIRKIGNRGILFTYYDLEVPTNIYIIVTDKKYFIIDTYLGNKIMKEIDSYLKLNYGEKEFIIINTHSDWDHIWGNDYFKNSMIISHRLCREEIMKTGEYYLEKNSEYKREVENLKLPNLIFEEKIIFAEEEIEIYYSPGHTEYSISIYDKVDKVLYTGDNIEGPIPYIQSIDIENYIETLDNYLKKDIDTVLGGHILIEDKNIIIENRNYLLDILNKKEINIKDSDFLEIHSENLAFLKKG